MDRPRTSGGLANPAGPEATAGPGRPTSSARRLADRACAPRCGAPDCWAWPVALGLCPGDRAHRGLRVRAAHRHAQAGADRPRHRACRAGTRSTWRIANAGYPGNPGRRRPLLPPYGWCGGYCSSKSRSKPRSMAGGRRLHGTAAGVRPAASRRRNPRRQHLHDAWPGCGGARAAWCFRIAGANRYCRGGRCGRRTSGPDDRLAARPDRMDTGVARSRDRRARRPPGGLHGSLPWFCLLPTLGIPVGSPAGLPWSAIRSGWPPCSLRLPACPHVACGGPGMVRRARVHMSGIPISSTQLEQPCRVFCPSCWPPPSPSRRWPPPELSGRYRALVRQFHGQSPRHDDHPWPVRTMTAKLTLDQAGKAGSLEVKIDSTSANTGDAKHEPGSWAAKTYGPRSRDEHLRTGDFFNSAEFPELVYKSTRFNFSGDNLESIDGTLTMLGVTKPLKLTVTSFKCGPNPFTKKPMCGADAVGVVKRTDFGMKFAVPAISDEVKLPDRRRSLSRVMPGKPLSPPPAASRSAGAARRSRARRHSA